MTSKPFVLAHPADHYACGNYRVLDPLHALIRAGKIEGLATDFFLDDEIFLSLRPDVVIFQRVLEREQIAAMKRYRELLPRAKFVMEIDDLISEIPETNRFRKGFHNDALARFKEATAFCDRLVTSTAFLQHEYGPFAPESIACQNTLPDRPWAALPAHHSKQLHNKNLRVGWAGSSGHLGDLKLLIPVVQKTRHFIDWVFFGAVPEALRKLAAEYHPAVPISDYPAKLATLALDLAVAPLEVSRYNHAKSALRILELGACGYPVLCSDGPEAFNIDLPVYRVENNPASWIERLTALDQFRAFLPVQAHELRKAIMTDYLLSKRLDDWFAAWCLPLDESNSCGTESANFQLNSFSELPL